MSATDVEREHDRTSSDWRSPLLDWSESAFWIGLSVVVLSLVSALATYLILTGLTPIAPRTGIVYAVLFVNIVLIVAMIGVISWQVRGLWRRGATRCRARACTPASSGCSA